MKTPLCNFSPGNQGSDISRADNLITHYWAILSTFSTKISEGDASMQDAWTYIL